MVSTAGIAPAASTFARWRSDLTELRGQLALGHLASVIGLAPIRPDLKGRLRELLCIHGQKRVVPEVGIAPTSPRLQRGANLPQLPEVFAHGESWSSRAVTLRGLRLHLPAALRERLSLWVAKPWVISIGIEGHLRVLPEELWSKYIRRLAHEIIR